MTGCWDRAITRSTFDASGLAGGVYVYTLETEGHTVTRSMTLMK